MSRVSSEFGDIIKDFLKRNSMTFRAAGLKTGVSAAYWKDMSDGRVPSEDIISKISEPFDDLDENELRAAAGYAPNPATMDALTAVSIALRHQKDISKKAKQQILDFVKEIQDRNKKKKNA